MFYVYILYSATSDLYYVGYTKDYDQRVREHNQSLHSTFTSKHRPWDLKAVYFCGNDEKTAINMERFIKRQKSRRLIAKLIKGGTFTGILAQLVRVPHVRD